MFENIRVKQRSSAYKRSDLTDSRLVLQVSALPHHRSPRSSTGWRAAQKASAELGANLNVLTQESSSGRVRCDATVASLPLLLPRPHPFETTTSVPEVPLLVRSMRDGLPFQTRSGEQAAELLVHLQVCPGVYGYDAVRLNLGSGSRRNGTGGPQVCMRHVNNMVHEERHATMPMLKPSRQLVK